MPNFSIAAPYSRGSAANGYGPNSGDAEIHEVIRVVFPADVAPEIGIGDAQHELVAVVP